MSGLFNDLSHDLYGDKLPLEDRIDHAMRVSREEKELAGTLYFEQQEQDKRDLEMSYDQ